MITYYTDGSCDPNPGTGGFAVIKNMEPAVLGGEPHPTMEFRDPAIRSSADKSSIRQSALRSPRSQESEF